MGKARIVAGDAGGRLLAVPRGVRPTSGISRKIILDSLGSLSEVNLALDLFSGSGILSSELLSRGVKRLIAVERSRRIATVWKENIQLLHYSHRTEILVMPVQKALSTLLKKALTFDLVVADPPYGSKGARGFLADVEWGELLAHNGILVLEQTSRDSAPRPKGVISLWNKKIGDTSAYAFIRESKTP